MQNSGEFHGWKSLVGYSPWGWKQLDTTEQLHFHFSGDSKKISSCHGCGWERDEEVEQRRSFEQWKYSMYYSSAYMSFIWTHIVHNTKSES